MPEHYYSTVYYLASAIYGPLLSCSAVTRRAILLLNATGPETMAPASSRKSTGNKRLASGDTRLLKPQVEYIAF